MHILHPLVPGTRARREILQDLEVWTDYGEAALNGAHQGPEKGRKKGLRDYGPLTGQDGLLPGIHSSAEAGSNLFQFNTGEGIYSVW